MKALVLLLFCFVHSTTSDIALDPDKTSNMASTDLTSLYMTSTVGDTGTTADEYGGATTDDTTNNEENNTTGDSETTSVRQTTNVQQTTKSITTTPRITVGTVTRPISSSKSPGCVCAETTSKGPTITGKGPTTPRPGATQMPITKTSNTGTVVGVAFGMLIIGAILGVVGVCVFQRYRSKSGYGYELSNLRKY